MTGEERFHSVMPGELAAGKQYRLGDRDYHALVDVMPPLENPQGFLDEACQPIDAGQATYLGNLVIGKNLETGELHYATRIHFSTRGNNSEEARESLLHFTDWLSTALTVAGEKSNQKAQIKKLYKPQPGGQG